MNCEYCYYYSECLKTLEKKNNEIELLKKKLHNTQRSKLRLKNNLNFKIQLLEAKLKDYEIQDDWDEINVDNATNTNLNETKIKND